MHNTDGSSTKTTTVDQNGTVTTTEETTDADGNTTTVTTTCDKNTNPDCGAGLTTPDQDTGGGQILELDPHEVDRPTLHEMREHPTNNPGDGGFEPSDLDWDGEADLVAGHLDGKIDPAPDTVELAVDQAPEVHAFNGAGPEFVPELQTDLGPLAPSGNGPIESNPQASLHP